jgi:hypothetical protein
MYTRFHLEIQFLYFLRTLNNVRLMTEDPEIHMCSGTFILKGCGKLYVCPVTKYFNLISTVLQYSAFGEFVV